MNRRSVLRGAGVAGTVAVAGCLERLGFERESAWRNPPLVEDRPDAVYVPAGIDEMGVYGTAAAGDVAVALSYTFPHRFWLVRDDDVSPVEVGADDTHHLMIECWDRETRTTLPADLYVDVLRDGDPVDSFTPWPMLSQRMGFHYGDNVILAAEGDYTARIDVGDVLAEQLGAFDGRFEEPPTLEIDFEYRRSDVSDLSFESVERARRGERGALPLMHHEGDGGGGGGDHDANGGGDGSGHDANGDGGGDHAANSHGDHAHGGGELMAPGSRVPSVDALPGTHLGTERSGDATFAVGTIDDAEFAADGETYLSVSLRTPHNRVVIPGAALSATVQRGGEVLAEPSLAEALHEDLGHHYGATVDAVESGDVVTITADRPPHVTRHDGYETAFLSFVDVAFTR